MTEQEETYVGQTLVGGKWITVEYPSLKKVQEAVRADYNSNPEGFAERVLDQLAGFVCSEQGYYNQWCKTVVLTASSLLEENNK